MFVVHRIIFQNNCCHTKTRYHFVGYVERQDEDPHRNLLHHMHNMYTQHFYFLNFYEFWKKIVFIRNRVPPKSTHQHVNYWNLNAKSLNRNRILIFYWISLKTKKCFSENEELNAEYQRLHGHDAPHPSSSEEDQDPNDRHRLEYDFKFSKKQKGN